MQGQAQPASHGPHANPKWSAMKDVATGVAVWGALIAVLVLSPVFGSISSIVAVLFGFGLLPLTLERDSMATLLRAPAQALFLASFVALGVAFTLTALAPGDTLFLANFLALPLSGLLYLWARKLPASQVLCWVTALCLSGVAVATGFALFDIFGRGLPRAMGLVGNPNLMPRTALILGFVALGGAVLARTRRRWFYVAGPPLALLVTFLSGSRGAALAVPTMAILAAALVWRDRFGRLVVLGTMGILAIGALALLILGDSSMSRFTSIGQAISNGLLAGGANVDPATGERLGMHRVGLAAFAERPWLGWGWAHLGTAAAAVDPSSFAKHAGSRFMYHNDALNFAVAGGVVGLVAWLMLLAAPVVGALASPHDGHFAIRLYCCLQLSLGYAMFGLTDMSLGYDLPTTLYAFLTALALGAGRSVPSTPRP